MTNFMRIIRMYFAQWILSLFQASAAKRATLPEYLALLLPARKCSVRKVLSLKSIGNGMLGNKTLGNSTSGNYSFGNNWRSINEAT